MVCTSIFPLAQEFQALCHISEAKIPFEILPYCIMSDLYCSIQLYFGHHSGILLYLDGVASFQCIQSLTILHVCHVFRICKLVSKSVELTQWGFVT
jgi:hypothetical protein